jgi:hypothetical protein
MIGEGALVALAAAIHLADCVVLLERGQALIEARWRGVALSFGSKHYQISGKSVALLNPLTPFFCAFRSLPLFSGGPGKELGTAMHALRPLATLAALQFLLVFAVLPYCLYRAPGWPFFVALVFAYVNAVAMLLLLRFRFKSNSIPARPLIGLGFGWLVCLPLSVNCLRAAGVSFPLGLDARRALRFVHGGTRDKAREDLAAQVAEAMQEMEEADSHHARLAEFARQLQPEAGHGRL